MTEEEKTGLEKERRNEDGTLEAGSQTAAGLNVNT